MPKTTLTIFDEVNVKFDGLDVKTRRKIANELKFFIPYARHMPAFKLGRWDGMVSFATTGGKTSLNLLDKVLPIVIDAGYEIVIDDKRTPIDLNFTKVTEDVFSDKVWPIGHQHEGQPIVLRDYQVDVVNQFLENPQCLQEVATGAGKTLITATLSKLVEPYGRTIVIVPNRDLVSQTEEDYINLGLDVGVFYGGRNEWGKTHTICTWQSLNALDKKSKDHMTDDDIMDFIEGVVCIMVDEVHSAKADVLKKLLTNEFAHCPIRWGLTGTVPKEDFEFYSILASIGPVINKLAASELQAQNVLADCHVQVYQLKDSGEYKTYHEEQKFLLQNKKRIDHIGGMINEIVEDGNTLVLVQQITTGNMLKELIPDSVFVHGEVKSAERKENYGVIATEDNKVVIATYGVAAVGINLPRVFNLVLIEPGKSFVRVIQSIGRGLRKAQDKNNVQIYDIASTLKFSKRHLTKRKKIYKEAEYPYNVKKIDYL